MIKKNSQYIILVLLGVVLLFTPLMAQNNSASGNKDENEQLKKHFQALDHRLDQLEKAVDDILWYNKVGDVALIDKVFQVGPPPANIKNPTAMGAQNPVKFWSYIFIPRNHRPQP